MKSNQHRLSTYYVPGWAPVADGHSANSHSRHSTDVGGMSYSMNDTTTKFFVQPMNKVRGLPQTSM